MRVLVVFVVLASVAIALARRPLNLAAPAVTPQLIDKINSYPGVKFVAGVNTRFENGVSVQDAMRLMGVKLNGRRPALKVIAPQAVPDNFDSRTQWGKMCPSLSEVRDQANCGSCWAFGAVEAMTDRHCIFSNGTQQPHISAEDFELVLC